MCLSADDQKANPLPIWGLAYMAIQRPQPLQPQISPDLFLTPDTMPPCHRETAMKVACGSPEQNTSYANEPSNVQRSYYAQPKLSERNQISSHACHFRVQLRIQPLRLQLKTWDPLQKRSKTYEQIMPAIVLPTPSQSIDQVRRLARKVSTLRPEGPKFDREAVQTKQSNMGQTKLMVIKS